MIVKLIYGNDPNNHKVEYRNDKELLEFSGILSTNQIKELNAPKGKTVISYEAIKQLGEEVVKEEIKRIINADVDLLFKRLQEDKEPSVVVVRHISNPYKIERGNSANYFKVYSKGELIRDIDFKMNYMDVKKEYENKWHQDVLKHYNLCNYYFSLKEWQAYGR